jgi:hypothetical protein
LAEVFKKNKKAEEKFFSSAFLKDWRLPTLAEAIQPLPSATLCLTAVFGMGTGRTTALWPPNYFTVIAGFAAIQTYRVF